MFLEMSHRQLLVGLPTLQTCHGIFGETFPPINGLGCCVRRCNWNGPMRVLLRFECLQTGVRLLEGLMHLLWCKSVRFNLCENEVFGHFEQGLRHAKFLVEVGERIAAVCAPHCGMGYGIVCALLLGDTV